MRAFEFVHKQSSLIAQIARYDELKDIFHHILSLNRHLKIARKRPYIRADSHVAPTKNSSGL